MRLALIILITCFIASASSFAWTAEARDVDWNDLRGPMGTFVNPYDELTSDQVRAISTVSQIRARMNRESRIPESILEQLQIKENFLKKQGIDIDSVLEERDVYIEHRQKAMVAINSSLDGVKVRIPGYLLPLDFDGTLVMEFLLVPYVGACIHVPPPPPNQIVHVKLNKGFKTTGLYEPIFVEGHLLVENIEKEVYIADGSANIPMSYHIDSGTVEPYRM